MPRATRSSCRSTPTARTARCCCSSGRPTASICRLKCCSWTARAPSREIGVVKKDMPNIFVEAVTIADGRVFTEVKRNRRAARAAGAERGGHPLGRNVQAGPKGQGEDQADRFGRQAVRRLDRDGHLRQVGGVHLRRLQRAGDQGVLLEVAAQPPVRTPSPISAASAATSSLPNATADAESGRVRRHGGG